MPVTSATRIRHAAGGPSRRRPTADEGLDPEPTRLAIRPLVIVGIATTLLLAVLIGAALLEGLTVADAVADPEETTGYRFLGIVSNVGVLLWASVVAILVFAAAVVDTSSLQGREWRRFLLAVAGVALLLLLDDFLLVHEYGDDLALLVLDFDPTRERKNVIESAVFAGYGMVAVGCGWRFRSRLRGVDRRPLVVATVLLGMSFVVDMRLHRIVGIHLPDGTDGPDLRSILEEGPKLLAIVYLVVFAGRVGQRAIDGSRAGDEADVAETRFVADR